MSADNGVYVLETLTASDGKEYRVAELGAIDNLSYDENMPPCHSARYYSKDPDVLIKNAREMFEGASLFTDKGQALIYAHEVADSLDVCEYGVNIISIPRQF